MVVLVLGFGPFGSVVDNPARRVALAVDGQTLGRGVGRIVGREMPVSYARSERLTLDLVEELGPALVLGVGVASGRTEALVEQVGNHRADPLLFDVDGVGLADHGAGQGSLVSASAAPLATALGVGLSLDAGGYVCNSWLFRALRAGLPAAFLLVPPSGFAAAALRSGLRRLVRARPGRS